MRDAKSRTVLCAAFLIVLSVLPAFADVTGTWTSDVKGAPPDGNDLLITFVFKQEGAKLTGTVALPGETANIKYGKVDGDKISFAVTMNVATFTYEGTIAGHEIKLTVKADNPDFPSREMMLKRSE